MICFNGEKFGYDIKAIVDYVSNNQLDVELYCGISKNTYFEYEKVNFIKIKTLKGIYHLMTSVAIIYNVNPPRYIPYRKDQILINTWHGNGYKKAGKYTSYFDKRQFNLSTCFISHSKKYTEWFLKDSIEFQGDILNIGAPRNDVFFNKRKDLISKKIREKYKIENKKIVLFAPTFRNIYEKPDVNLDFDELIKIFKRKFEGEWIILLRYHPMIKNKTIKKQKFIINVSDYPDMQDLLCASDILITDYSGTVGDFLLMKKPIFAYTYDIENYIQNRGLYLLPDKWPFSYSKTQDELIKNILNFNENLYQEKIDFYYEYMTIYDKGNSCQELFKYIEEKVKSK